MTKYGIIETMVGAFLLYVVFHVTMELDYITQAVSIGELYTILLLVGLCLAYGAITFLDGIEENVDAVVNYFSRGKPT
jgi:uncharacterized membrane protein